MKKITAFAMGIVMLVGTLSGCISETRDTDLERIDVSDLSGVSKPNIAQIEFGDNSVNSGGSQTAEIDFSEAEYSVCIAEFGEYDTEKVKSAILGNIDITPEIIRRDKNEYPIYKWDKDDLSLIINNNSPNVELVGNVSMLAETLLDKPTKITMEILNSTSI